MALMVQYASMSDALRESSEVQAVLANPESCCDEEIIRIARSNNGALWRISCGGVLSSLFPDGGSISQARRCACGGCARIFIDDKGCIAFHDDDTADDADVKINVDNS